MDTFLTKLEYTQIIQIIESYCKTYLGKKQCNLLLPNFEPLAVENCLAQTNEALSLLHQKGSLPIFEIEELETYMKILESNQTLSLKGLLALSKFLQLSSSLHDYFYQDENFDLLPFSHLAPYFSNIYSNPTIEKNISTKILDENTIADNASSKLFALRKNRKSLEMQVKDKLNSYIHSAKFAKYIMDPIVTIRNSRYVIPVKEEYKEMVKGFVHDTSSSGSTLYMEPMAVFELNNQINHVKMEEEIEVQKILQVLSATLFPYTTELKQNLTLVGKLDLIFAKALYGKNTDAVIPQITSKKVIEFYKAWHPLLDKNIAVPIDICLGKDYECLLITGPNTGGKTVALKTVGLLLLMAYSGIPIPCSEKSSICVFSNIFVDIGDEQSIEQNLSTFSAHMKNIIAITNSCNSNSLALLDELGSGTDPLEGAALAISVLNFLKNKRLLHSFYYALSRIKRICFSNCWF